MWCGFITRGAGLAHVGSNARLSCILADGRAVAAGCGRRRTTTACFSSQGLNEVLGEDGRSYIANCNELTAGRP